MKNFSLFDKYAKYKNRNHIQIKTMNKTVSSLNLDTIIIYLIIQF